MLVYIFTQKTKKVACTIRVAFFIDDLVIVVVVVVDLAEEAFSNVAAVVAVGSLASSFVGADVVVDVDGDELPSSFVVDVVVAAAYVESFAVVAAGDDDDVAVAVEEEVAVVFFSSLLLSSI